MPSYGSWGPVPHEPGNRVDQVVFRWAGNRTGRAGIAAVAQSCDKGQAHDMAERLGVVLRVMGGERRTSIVRLRWAPGRMVLLRRTPGEDAHGRGSTVCHALVAPADLLSPIRCLAFGATPWAEDGWAERISGDIDTLSYDWLCTSAEAAMRQLPAAVAHVARPLECLVAQLLRTPSDRVSARTGELPVVPAPPDADGPADGPLDPALVVLFGLCGIFRKWLPGNWTYATYDTVDSHDLRVVFVPEWRPSHEEDARLRRIDLADPGIDRAARLARDLVRHYLDHVAAAGDAEGYVEPLRLAGPLDAQALDDEAARYDAVESALNGRPPRRPAPHHVPVRPHPAPGRTASPPPAPGLWSGPVHLSGEGEEHERPRHEPEPPAGQAPLTGPPAPGPPEHLPAEPPGPEPLAPGSDRYDRREQHDWRGSYGPAGPSEVYDQEQDPAVAAVREPGPTGRGGPPGPPGIPPHPPFAPNAGTEPAVDDERCAPGDHVLPGFLRTPPVFRPKKKPKWSRGSSWQGTQSASLPELISRLRYTCRSDVASGQWEHDVHEQLVRASDTELLNVLTAVLPYAAQNVVLQALAEIPRSEEEAARLAVGLCHRDFLLHSFRPRNANLSESHREREVKVALWLLNWLLVPFAARCPHEAGRFLHGLAVAPEGSAECAVLDGLLIDCEPAQLPELPGRVWLEVARGLRERAAGA
ncbi:hypothetical protein AB0K89_04355 [Streptomyces cinnamoneus]|uniref:hypothetical protein n=1 Tax=Streptomyces cinnamoneus TaxID=53446 RepID=UPI00341F1AA3